MKWTRSQTLALARTNCATCHGLGTTDLFRNDPCKCVLRAVFRACHNKFRSCSQRENYFTRATIRSNEGRSGLRQYALLDEEYMADFCLVAKRTLNGSTEAPDSLAYRIFKFHFLLGADWRMCAAKLGINRGEFYHELYRVEERLGKIFAELEPHALFPIDSYFFGARRAHAAVRIEKPQQPPQKEQELKVFWGGLMA